MTQQTNKPKLLLLTGAGFSIKLMAYEEFFLSTKFLTELLTNPEQFDRFTTTLCNELSDPENDIEKLKNIQRLCALVYTKLNEAEIKDANFEHIIYGLECIADRKGAKKETLLSALEHKIKVSVSDIEVREFDWQYLYAIKAFILDVVGLFQVKNEEVKNGKNKNPIKQFKDKLDNDYSTVHFTLNYDDLFVTTEDINGYCPKPNMEINHHNLDIKSYFLHGSVYFWRGETLGVGNKQIASENRKGILNSKSYFNSIAGTEDISYYDPFIIGIRKNQKLKNNGYGAMMAQLKKVVNEVDELMIIGYSFNDEHINEVLQEMNTNKISKVIVVDCKNTGTEQEFKNKVNSILNFSADAIEYKLDGVNSFLEEMDETTLE